MKATFNSLGILAIFLFASCASQPKIAQEFPVDIYEYYYQTWVAGARGAGSGINFTVALKKATDDIILKDVYFKGKVTSLKQKKQAPSVYVGYFRTEMNQKEDLIMSSDPNEEFGNPVPDITPNKPKTFPFELSDTEAVISYDKDGKLKYYKLLNVEERPTRQPPRMPQ